MQLILNTYSASLRQLNLIFEKKTDETKSRGTRRRCNLFLGIEVPLV
jgi:hypothetical protein